MRQNQGGKSETPVLRSTGGVQAEYSGVQRSTRGVQRSTRGVQWSTSGVQAEYGGVQVEYVKYGGVLEYRSLAFSPLDKTHIYSSGFDFNHNKIMKTHI